MFLDPLKLCHPLTMKRSLRDRYRELKEQVRHMAMSLQEISHDKIQAIEALHVFSERIESYKEENDMLRKQLQIAITALQKKKLKDNLEALEQIKAIRPHSESQMN